MMRKFTTLAALSMACAAEDQNKKARVCYIESLEEKFVLAEEISPTSNKLVGGAYSYDPDILEEVLELDSLFYLTLNGEIQRDLEFSVKTH